MNYLMKESMIKRLPTMMRLEQIDPNDIKALNDKGAALANLGKHQRGDYIITIKFSVYLLVINALYHKGSSLYSLGKYRRGNYIF